MELKDASILIVDDEPALLEIFKAWFDREGCRTFVAENGAAALALIKTNRFDMVLSDIRMPVMDGIELARNAKDIGSYLPKIIFLSGFSELDVREAYDLGMEAKLTKPLRRIQLLTVVRGCLMDRKQLWRNRVSGGVVQTLNIHFASLSSAMSDGMITIGRGGICVRSAFNAKVDEAIGLRLEFKNSHRPLNGEGIVRWAAPSEGQIGIEITYVDDDNRAWVAHAIERSKGASFIPRNSRQMVKIGGMDI